MTIIETLAAYAAKPGPLADSGEVIHHAKRAVVDWYAALIPGAVAMPATLLETALAEDLDRGGARLALGRAATVRTAALINGTAAHTVEVDDIYKHAIYHPGAPTIAAALAAGHAGNISGMDFLRAVIVGYEVSTRIGTAMGRSHYKYWHNTGTVGTFGAAAAATAILKLDAGRAAHALATCATFAAGLQQAFRMDSMSKPLHSGRAAEGGVLAALMAQAGVTGSLDVIDGEAGLGRAMSDGPDWAAAVATLGRQYNITQMTFKNHACCGHTFAAIDGARALQRQHGFSADDIASVRVATYRPALEVAGNPDPRTAAEARFSLPYVVSNALIHGSVRLAAFTPERLADAAVRSLMARIELQVDPDIDAAFPGKRAARVTVHTRDGGVFEHLQPNRKGDPEEPLSDDDLNDKFIELVGPVLGADAAAALLQRLWRLESAASLP
ncbi:2-methylcitrate dehydratase PrpD [Cupriavidus gilardii J11]|uniref:2-methylcitrate dehydratase PrpD n=1 Tax=Cupriavidus gilardii J11 TaxID=936133 RepID=A0A562BU06_9BURK|nr:MmgE/PrpD family protein [Cupriavidus gilardii]TWG88280.1 2-methylcitrate dehydratase PrpD [Cupriavidus gilardii J11]